MCASTSSSSSCIWYLAVLMDVHTRAIQGWELARHLDQALTVAALERALSTGRHPTIHHSDQGVQYAATAYIARLEQVGAQISMAEQGEPRQNGYAERLCRTAMPNGYAERLCRTAMPNA
jgi:transposase InsO family protein